MYYCKVVYVLLYIPMKTEGGWGGGAWTPRTPWIRPCPLRSFPPCTYNSAYRDGQDEEQFQFSPPPPKEVKKANNCYPKAFHMSSKWCSAACDIKRVRSTKIILKEISIGPWLVFKNGRVPRRKIIWSSAVTAMFRANVSGKIIQKMTDDRTIEALRTCKHVSLLFSKRLYPKCWWPKLPLRMVNWAFELGRDHASSVTADNIVWVLGDITNCTVGNITFNVTPLLVKLKMIIIVRDVFFQYWVHGCFECILLVLWSVMSCLPQLMCWKYQ